MIKKKVKIVKEGYTFYEYLLSDSYAWINTKVKFNKDNNYEFYLKHSGADNNRYFNAVLGTSNYQNGFMLLFSEYSSTSNITYPVYIAGKDYISYRRILDYNKIYETKCNIDFSNNKLYYEFDNNKATTDITNLPTSDDDITTFPNNSCASKVKIYNIQISVNNTLVRDLVPTSNGTEYGLYDLVNDVFYTNQGTGEFTVGEEVDVWRVKEVKEVKKKSRNLLDCSKCIFQGGNPVIDYGVDIKINKDYIEIIGTPIVENNFSFNGVLLPIKANNIKYYIKELKGCSEVYPYLSKGNDVDFVIRNPIKGEELYAKVYIMVTDNHYNGDWKPYIQDVQTIVKPNPDCRWYFDGTNYRSITSYMSPGKDGTLNWLGISIFTKNETTCNLRASQYNNYKGFTKFDFTGPHIDDYCFWIQSGILYFIIDGRNMLNHPTWYTIDSEGKYKVNIDVVTQVMKEVFAEKPLIAYVEPDITKAPQTLGELLPDITLNTYIKQN